MNTHTSVCIGREDDENERKMFRKMREIKIRIRIREATQSERENNNKKLRI